MEIVYRKPSELIPYENNPRKNDEAVDAVAASIRDFGFKVPIILDKDDVIVAGHTRLKAAQKLGLEEVPCVIADDLTEEQIRAFRLADNKTGELAGWDWQALEAEMQRLEATDLTLYGFDQSIMDGLNIDDFFTEAEAKEPKHKTATCPACGEVFEI